jgi:RNase P protein component
MVGLPYIRHRNREHFPLVNHKKRIVNEQRIRLKNRTYKHSGFRFSIAVSKKVYKIKNKNYSKMHSMHA